MARVSDLEYVLTSLNMDNVIRMLSFWHIETLVAAQRASRTLNAFVATYRQEAWDIDRHFTRWFPDAVEFRQVLGASKGVVGGSNVLQFFDRSVYQSSDLNIFVPVTGLYVLGNWLNDIYTYQPENGGHKIFEQAAMDFSSNNDLIINGPAPRQARRVPDVLLVMSFVRVFCRNGEVVMQKVTMTVVSHNPIWYILKQKTSM